MPGEGKKVVVTRKGKLSLVKIIVILKNKEMAQRVMNG